MNDLFQDAVMLFIIVNPFGNIPIMMDLTSGFSRERQRKALTYAVLIAASLLFSVSLAGQQMLDRIFHVGINELKIMGGLVLLTLAVKNIVAGAAKKKKGGRLEDIVAVPMAFPMLVAAVSFVTGILIMQKFGFFAFTALILAVFSAVWLILIFLSPLFNRLGEANLMIISKVMYIILASKAMKILLTAVFRPGG